VVLIVGAGAVLSLRPRTAPPQLPPKTPEKLQPIPDPPTPTPTTQTQTGIEQQAHRPDKLQGPLRVAVLKFKNVGADARLTSLEGGIGESALTSLASASKDVTLIERADVDSDIKEIDRAGDFHFDALTVAKSGQLKGIEIAVQGGFQKVGKQLRITARFVRVETGEVLDTLSVTRASSDVFDAQDAVAAGLKTKLLALAAQEKAKR
jgi:TolB-like protein